LAAAEKEQERTWILLPQLPAQTTTTPTCELAEYAPVMQMDVLRRDVTTDSTERPTQSAVCYIHGAFPVGPARNSGT
jgi:hypothetical protein